MNINILFSLKDMITSAVPFIEVINREQIVEAGYRYKEEIIRMKAEIIGQGKIGTYQGDRILDEAENDPNMKFKDDNDLDN